MGNNQPKTINGLMKYLRDNKGMNIKNSYDKQRLRSIGYYHGYKGYRYIRRPSNIINYSTFEELYSVYEFDMQLKTMLYPHVMRIETALKNYVLEEVLDETHSSDFNTIYTSLLTNYRNYIGSDNENGAIKNRLALRDAMFKAQTTAFESENEIARHYIIGGRNIPIWGLFELITLGQFGHFIKNLDVICKKNLSKKVGFKRSNDSSGALLENIVIKLLRDLRNSIAHNDIIFDTRFNSKKVSKTLISSVSNELNISQINFNSIIDYLALIVLLQRRLKVSKKELKRLLMEFEVSLARLKISIPQSAFDSIIGTNYQAKLLGLQDFIKNS